jgi:hypothetical protein
MTQAMQHDIEDTVRTVETQINYVAPGSFINRRFVAPGVEHNTGQYEPHTVTVRDGRAIANHFKLDTHGFVLANRPSKVMDFFDTGEVDRVYPDEVLESIKALTGAQHVSVMGWMVRTSGDMSKYKRETANYQHKGGVQPPAGEAHVDTSPDRADRVAQMNYERAFPNGKGYSRYIYASFWRCFSEPPQDMPLAVCDSRSIRPDEGTTNTLFIVDKIPDAATMLGPMPGEDLVPGAHIFHYNPNHRWWYFSNMNRDECLYIKFHDSDRSRAWRTPHTAFHDPSFANAKTRSSIEVRTVAYFD